MFHLALITRDSVLSVIATENEGSLAVITFLEAYQLMPVEKKKTW